MQLSIDFWEYLKERLHFEPKCTAACEASGCVGHACDLLEDVRTTYNVLTDDNVNFGEIAHILRCARNACRYVKTSVTRLRMKYLIKQLCRKLQGLCSALREDLDPAIRCGDDYLAKCTSQDLVDRFAICSHNLTTQCSDRAKWVDLDSVFEISITIYARVCGVTGPRSHHVDCVGSVLSDRNFLLHLYGLWRDAADDGRAHGLGPHVACVLLHLFDIIFL